MHRTFFRTEYKNTAQELCKLRLSELITVAIQDAIATARQGHVACGGDWVSRVKGIPDDERRFANYKTKSKRLQHTDNPCYFCLAGAVLIQEFQVDRVVIDEQMDFTSGSAPTHVHKIMITLDLVRNCHIHRALLQWTGEECHAMYLRSLPYYNASMLDLPSFLHAMWAIRDMYREYGY